MFCPKCGNRIPEDQRACSICGAVPQQYQQPQPQPQPQVQPQPQPQVRPQPQPQGQPTVRPQGQPVNAPAPQGGGTKKIVIPIAIIGGVIVTLLIIIVAIIGLDSGDSYTDPYDPGEYTDVTEGDITDPEEVIANVQKQDYDNYEPPVSDDVTNFGYADYYKVSANGGLYIRSLPSTEANAIICIPQYAMVSVVGYSTSEPHWYYVRYNDYEGFVNSKYLYQPSGANYRITMSDGLNLRTEPSLNSEIILEIPYDDVVQFIRYNGRATWAYVAYGQYYGWVSTPYLAATNRSAPSYVDIYKETTEKQTTTTEEFKPEELDPNTTFDACVVTMDEGLNLRTGPSTDDEVIVTMSCGEYAVVTDYDSTGEWAYVYYQNYSGWASVKYLDYAFGDPDVPAHFTVTMSDGLNVREGDNTSCDIVTELDPGTTGYIYACNYNATWVFIEAEGYKGWVSVKGIELSE